MSNGIFETTAPAYYAKGLPVIPLYRREKRPLPNDWSRYHDKPVEEDQATRWVQDYPDSNIGMVLGKQSGIVMMDIDTEDEGIINLLMNILPPSPWRRVGQKGCVLAYRYSGLPTFRIKDANGASICELLSERTQCVLPPSIHPKTQRPYKANCDLVDVVGQLPVLDNQIEAILRGALKEHGVNLSITGSSKSLDFVSVGSRDVSLTERAGLFSYAVLRGERSLVEAIGMLRSFEHDFVEKVAGDKMDIDKHVTNLVRFLHRDVVEKGRALPPGWDDGLTDEMRESLGLDFDKDHIEWTFDEMKVYLRDEFERHPENSQGRTKAVEYILARVAGSQSLSKLEEDRLLQYIVDVAKMGVRLPTLRAQIRELRMGEINGNDHAEIARAVISDYEAITPVRSHNNRLWKWLGSHWGAMENSEILRKIATDYGTLPAARKASDHKGIMSTILSMAEPNLAHVDLQGVNFANGFLTTDLELLPHDPDFGMTYTLPFRYLPETAGKSENFFQFMEDCWGEDPDYSQKISAMQEALCVTLFGMGPKYQRAILLQGVAKSGKSQMLKIAQSIVPDDAKAFVPPNEWADKFLPTTLYGKIINVCGELSEKKKIDGMKFKDIIDGGEMSGQFKGQDIFKFRPICTHWFASNHTPKTEDTSEGFNRRWLIFEFNHPVPPEKRKVDIGDIIATQERESITAWAVMALPRLLARSEYTLPDSHQQLIRDMAQENNSVRFFMEESRKVMVVRDSDKSTSSRISEDRLFKEYFSFCLGPGGARPVTLKQFRNRMKELASLMGFRLVMELTSLGGQQAVYESVTLVDSKAA